MSKFQSTVSTVAALASIFGAAAAGWKLAEGTQQVDPTPEIQQKITELEKKITEKEPEPKAPIPVQLPPVATTPPAVTLPAPPPPVPSTADQTQTTP